MKIVYKKKFYRPITFSKNGLLLYKNNRLFLLNPDDYSIEFFSKIKIRGLRGLLSKTRFLTRLLHRYVFCGITPSNKNYSFITFNDGVYLVDYEKKEVFLSMQFKHKDMHRPLSFFEIFNISGFKNSIVFGEYSYNKERHSISIYQFYDGEWHVAYSFPPGSIRHIHSIIQDEYRNRVLILTGDLDNESAIWEARNNFKSISVLYSGKQDYRFCCAMAVERGVILATDSPFEQNKLFLLNESNKLEELANLPGPSVFFTLLGKALIFATDVENDEKNLSPIAEFFVNKKGDGVLDDYSHIFKYEEKTGLVEVFKFKKDFYPMRLFGFGTVHFADGNRGNKLFCYPMSVKQFEQTLLCFEIENGME